MQKDKMPETIWRECEERIAMDQRQYLTGLMSRCYDARDGHPGEEKLRQLFDEASPFCGIPIAGKYVAQAIAEKNLSKLVGALGMCLSADGGDRVSVTQNATAVATASASAYADAVASIESLESISEEDKAELEKLMLDVKSAKDESMLKHAAKTLMDKAIEKGIDTLPSVLPVIIQAAQGMM